MAADPAQAERVRRMTEWMREWQRQLGDTAPLEVPQPRPAAFVPPKGAELDAIRARWRLPPLQKAN